MTELSSDVRRVLPHLSASSYDQFRRCPAQWEYVRVKGIKIAPGITAPIGSGLHGAAEANFRQKIITGEDLPKSDMVDAAVSAYKKRVMEEGVFVTREEKSMLKEIVADGVNQTKDYTEALADEAVAEYNPAAVEWFLSYHDPDLPIPWVGYVDIATTDGRIADWKTAGKKWNTGREHSETQGTVYRKLYAFDQGHEPEEVAFDVFHKSKNGVQRDKRVTVRTDEDWEALKHGANTMIKMVSAGLFPPCAPGSWNCSPKYCGLWWVCKHIPERLRRIPNV